MWGPVSNALLHEVIAGQPTVTLCVDLRSQTALDFSLLQRHGVITDPVKFSTAGAHFAGVGRITHPDHALGRNTTGAIVVLCKPGNGVFVSAEDVGGRRITVFASATVFYLNADILSNSSVTNIGMSCFGFNYTSGSKTVYYKNGLYANTAELEQVISDNDSPIGVGNYVTGAGVAFGAPIACVLETNRPLTAAEHLAVYTEMAACRWPTQPWTRGVLDV